MANSVRLLEIGMSGFKTFPDSIQIPLSQGLTAIVGPNGCGKTNIFDAMRFVMGETAPRTLRCKDLDDVIFAGNDKKAKRNIAEVTLLLHVPHHENVPFVSDDGKIEISRRIERGVGSEWHINGREVRARDVTLFLGDIATGSRSNMIMAQNTIHSFIESSPQQRRGLLEEAAGVSGLYARRDEATRKLKAAATQLERMFDIIQELKAHKRKLKKDAAIAEKYLRIKKRVKTIEISIKNYENLIRHRKQTQAQQALQQCQQQLTQLEATDALLFRRLGRMEEIQKPLLHKITKSDDQWQNLKSEKESIRIAGNHRTNHLKNITSRFTELTKDQQQSEKEFHTASGHLRDYQSQQVQPSRENKKQLEHNLQEKQEAWQQSQKNYAQAKEDHDRQQRRQEGQEEQHIELKKEWQKQDNDLKKWQQQLKNHGDKPQNIDKIDLTTLKTQLEDLRQKTEEARIIEAQLESQLRHYEIERARLKERLDGQSHHVLSQDAIIHHIQTHKGYEKALAAALGYDLDAHHQESQEHASWHAALSPSSSDPVFAGDAPPLSNYVKAPASLQRRLRQIFVCDTFKDGQALWNNLSMGQRLVSKEGHLWRWDGFYAPASFIAERVQVMERQNIQEQLQKDYDDIIEKIKLQQKEQFEAKSERLQKMRAEEETRRNYEKLYEQRLAQQDELGRRQDIDRHIKAILQKKQDIEKQLNEWTEELASEPSTSDAELQSLASMMQGCQQEKETSQRILMEYEATQNVAQQAVQRQKNEQEAWQQSILNCQQRLKDIQKRISDTHRQEEILKQEEQQSHHRLTQLEPIFEELDRTRHIFLHQKKRMESMMLLKRQELSKVNQGMEEIRLEKARHEERLLQSQQDNEDENEDRDEFTQPDDLPTLKNEEERITIQNEATDLMSQMEQMELEGGVNLRADHDMKNIEERLDQLSGETKDVQKAIESFRHAVRDINQRGRKKLKDAFHSINKHFKELFVQLFGGGEAAMNFVNSDDPLEAGLDILVQLPGRKTKSLSLLSGGERSMTALALMLAIFTTRPAPLCLLDEVDDALDEQNIGKFCELLQSIAHNHEARFILVTHRPLTMSHMDRLYGVTMREVGISHVVSLDMKQAEQLALSERKNIA